MEFVGAFFVCALICLAAQLIVECIPEVHGPTLFIAIQFIGALLVPLGAIAALQGLGQAGMVITVFNAGATVCIDVIDMMGGGSAVPLITIFGVFLVVAVFGIIAGALRAKLVAKGKEEKGE